MNTDVKIAEIEHLGCEAYIRKVAIFCLDNCHIAASPIVFFYLRGRSSLSWCRCAAYWGTSRSCTITASSEWKLCSLPRWTTWTTPPRPKLQEHHNIPHRRPQHPPRPACQNRKNSHPQCWHACRSGIGKIFGWLLPIIIEFRLHWGCGWVERWWCTGCWSCWLSRCSHRRWRCGNSGRQWPYFLCLIQNPPSAGIVPAIRL